MKILPIIALSISALLLSGCNNYEEALKEAPVLSANINAGLAVFEKYNCASCHGQDARTSALGVSRIIPEIDTARDVENALYALQSLTSDRHPVMKGVAANLNSQEIVDVASYVNSLQ